MKKFVLLAAVAALMAYGIYDIVRTVKSAYTTGYSRTYSHAVGLTMCPRFDSLRLTGKGIRIGVLDAGFGGFRTSRWTRGLCVGGYRDFTGGDPEAFFRDEEDHGTEVCTNIGGFAGDTLRGLACGATYYLAKTERADTELRSEETQLIRGIEWLLTQEVDIISSSLAYTGFDDFSGYTPRMLDGRSSALSGYIDSLLRANPSLVFVQSVGNEGDEAWRYISFPADVQGVISVGESDFDGTKRARSSGVGYDGVDYLKPDFALPASPKGSSFTTPVITGLCACLLEYRPVVRDSLMRLLHAAGSNAAAPDREIGYGVPRTATYLELLDQADER